MRLLIILLFISGTLSSQSIFELELTPEGIVLPTITKAEKLNLSPKEGQVFYNPDSKGLMLYDGADWISITGEVVVTAVDIDGNVYETQQIGDLTWFTSNLNTTKLNDGTPITMSGSGSLVDNGTNKSATSIPTLWYYNNDPVTFVPTYGALYNHCAVATGLLCPSGWRVPTSTDFASLATALGGDAVAGGKLKETGTTNWIAPNTGATNSSGWNGVPGGFVRTGSFIQLGVLGNYWIGDNSGLVRNLHAVSEALGADQLDLSTDGASVRCVR